MSIMELVNGSSTIWRFDSGGSWRLGEQGAETHRVCQYLVAGGLGTCLFLVVGCGSRSAIDTIGGTNEGDRRSSPTDSGAASDGIDGGRPEPSGCTPAWHSCGARTDCCSEICWGEICIDCRVAGEPCVASGQCCSGSCEPDRMVCQCSPRGGPHAYCRTDADCCGSRCDPTTSWCSL